MKPDIAGPAQETDMLASPEIAKFDYLRRQTVGSDAAIPTPFGSRRLLYADHIASGRCLGFVEDMIGQYQRLYANTHTGDDETGRRMSVLLKDAEESIRKSVNAGSNHRIISCGTGATGGIYRLQQILGIALPPVTRWRLEEQLREFVAEKEYLSIMDAIRSKQPVVFVGPYEHHSNEISWRAGLATVVEVDLDDEGGIDLAHLSRLLEDPQYKGRLRIGSFSAASNVTGMRTPVHEIARILHRGDALAFFDFAAAAPYIDIDMSPPPGEDGRDASLDAIFLSPHKFLGGPGSSGILVFNESLYTTTLAPTVAGGGTVSYVSPHGEDFFTDIEEREKAGTPGTLQILRAALAFAVKDRVTAERIEARDAALLQRAFARWQNNPAIEILGNPDPAKRLAIVSFNVKVSDQLYLHPKFVTALLNDLFGVQSRAGCACAGPYGHRLLGIDNELSEKYRAAIREGNEGVKPGWCRVGFHYTMDDAEAGFLIDAVDFVARYGSRFLDLYDFDLRSGLWNHKEAPSIEPRMYAEAAWRHRDRKDRHLPLIARKWLYRSYLRTAERWAKRLDKPSPAPEGVLPGKLQELQFFSMKGAVSG